MIPLGTPHSFGNAKPASQTGTPHNSQEKMQLENRLRIKKLEIKDQERHLHDFERDISQLEGETHRAEQQVARVEGEVRSVVMGARKEEGLTKEAEQGMREKAQGIHGLHEKEEKVRREILALKREIETKEHELALLHDDERQLVKEKEDFRRQYEMEHFTARSGSEHAHEKELEAVRYEREADRKKTEIMRKKGDHDRVKQEILRKEEEVRSIETELRRLG
ncbi:MAG: hypothetical protein A3H76_01100 [Candidatus Lloydbacteria bacterium RIFCSPLOWO2_02_FULL_54_12]|nr:MAG: hypothetical protein A3H76_01100 [Candidatus Lloydbacteria bacterium RIFCSPLOWO2_02_FULL_54_12]